MTVIEFPEFHTTLRSAARDCPPRFATPRVSSRNTYGHVAAKIAEALDKELMPWQRQVLDTALEVDDSGLLVYREVVVTVPRQNGKSLMMLVLVLLRALGNFGGGRQNLVYTAQTRHDARNMLVNTWDKDLEGTQFSELYKLRLSNGDESFTFENSARLSLVASTAKSGHGSTLDLAIVDEFFAQNDDRLEQALRPAMNTRPEPQMWFVSTRGVIGLSEPMEKKIQRGREHVEQGLTTGTCYFEWSADPDADPADEETWWSCMPALGRTITVQTVRDVFESMSLSEFKRAYLNVPTLVQDDPIVPLDSWASLHLDTFPRPSDQLSDAQDIYLAVDAAPDGSHASISAAHPSAIINPDEDADEMLVHFSAVDCIEYHEGLAWVLPRLEALQEKYSIPDSRVIYDTYSPLAAVIDASSHAKTYYRTSTRDFGNACIGFTNAVAESTIRHSGNDLLLIAITGASTRRMGDLWKFNRTGTTDISPLVSASLALWGLLSNATKRPSNEIQITSVEFPDPAPAAPELDPLAPPPLQSGFLTTPFRW